jgi:hypothetical protein
MRARWSVLFLIASLGALATASLGFSGAAAQSDSLAVSMEPMGIYYMNGETPVHIEESAIDASVSAGFGPGTKTYITLAGAKSDVEINDPLPRFRILAKKSEITAYRLGVFKVKKNMRQLRTDMKATAHEFFQWSVPLKIRRLREGAYELTPTLPLQPGEYGIANAVGPPVADFTITLPEEKKGK